MPFQFLREPTLGCFSSIILYLNISWAERSTLLKKGLRGVRFEGYYSPGGVLVWVVAEYARVLTPHPTNNGVLRHYKDVLP